MGEKRGGTRRGAIRSTRAHSLALVPQMVKRRSVLEEGFVMKVAVSGATGFVGKAVLRRLSSQGDRPVPIVRVAAGLPDEVVTGDLGVARIDPAKLAGAECVIHLAARTHVINETATDAGAAYMLANVEGTRALVDAAIAAGVRRFVFMSSAKAMGESTAPGAPFNIRSPARPQDDYGRSKLAAEELVRARCGDAGIDWVIIRPPLVYGPGVKGNLDRLVSLMARRIPLPLGAIANRRSMVHVDTLAEATVRACVAPGAANRELLIADATVSTTDLLRAMADALGTKARLIPVPARLLAALARVAGRTAESGRLLGSLELDTRDSFAALGWTPTLSLGEGLRSMVSAREPFPQNARLR